MNQLSVAGQQSVDAIAQRHGFSTAATLNMLEAVINGNGGMAQFDHPEFAGSGQWMRGGMTMVSDMFNNRLKDRVDALCLELSDLVSAQPDVARSGTFQSQTQHDGRGSGHEQRQAGQPGKRHSAGAGNGSASLFLLRPETSGPWWPSDLQEPDSTGAQNGVRYAYFAQAGRLAIDFGGSVTVYDTLDHKVSGFSQQQSVGGTLSFSSQHGLIDVAGLPVVSSNGDRVQPDDASSSAALPAAVPKGAAGLSHREQNVLATIEKLADLKARGILNDEEFAAKKAELLARI